MIGECRDGVRRWPLSAKLLILPSHILSREMCFTAGCDTV